MVDGFSSAWFGIIAAVVSLLGFTGWSHKTLSHKIMELETLSLSRLTEHQVRQIISDKLNPLEVEYRSLSLRIDDVRLAQRSLDAKLERIIELMHEK